MFKKVTTEQYPEEKDKYPPKPRFHGRHQLNRHPDGLENALAVSCVLGLVRRTPFMLKVRTTLKKNVSHQESVTAGLIKSITYAAFFVVLCIEACPTRALTMTNEYELADDSREKLIFTKEDLLAPLLAGMELPPHEMAPGTTAIDYYEGKVGSSPTPSAVKVGDE